MPLAQREIKATITTISGEVKHYNFVALKRREAVEVFHLVLIHILSALSGLTDGSSGIHAIVTALQGIKFDDFWEAARKLLRSVVIDGEEIADIDNSDYFSEHVDELYLAVVQAIRGNYPAVFQNLEQAISAVLNTSSNQDSTPRE